MKETGEIFPSGKVLWQGEDGEAHRENLRLLGEHREELDELASRLLDRVEIAGDEVREVVGRRRRRKGEEAAAADQAAA